MACRLPCIIGFAVPSPSDAILKALRRGTGQYNAVDVVFLNGSVRAVAGGTPIDQPLLGPGMGQ
ncbi:hypothetical protein CBOM_04211 [Ceraceosorus bombacis]|uniref:Uncharacterized protein n=1 Tax=Ceraceosorus bombacis TaxID=401625 RepID=A0A0P1BNL0_9BASI|nr:hypothetical protein CBOM_04211 [Ceraceosorus bombacis]